jgi:hypothetical protein
VIGDFAGKRGAARGDEIGGAALACAHDNPPVKKALTVGACALLTATLAGLAATRPEAVRARAWLVKHQDPSTGMWLRRR